MKGVEHNRRKHKRWLLGKARVPGLPGRLRQARVEAGLTLELAGERLDVSPNTVWRWEAGAHEPSKGMLEEAAALYRRPTAWFFGEEAHAADQPTVADPELRAVLAAWDDLTPVECAFILAAVRTALEQRHRRRLSS